MTNLKTPASFLLACLFALSLNSLRAQELSKADSALLKIYRATPPKINDLIHTKLDVRFDYGQRFMYGKEWVTLRPHFYPTDTLRLDAKGMDITQLALLKGGKLLPLRYRYEDSLSLAIQLDRIYHHNERYTLFIAYTAKPNLLKAKGSAAINDAKGLYFINPDSTEKGKPVQIWTQGETESSSAWFPTIDKPEQKTTEEISMTVPAKYVTLSNGRLAAHKRHADGTRTDTWVMDLPHSPYLFMMAVGDFKVYHDHWRNKPVDYYLEPKYAPYAKEIFGMTPDLIEFYSRTLGVDFPWNKYAQIVVRDYVSGAMENTTATLHGEYVQGSHRELIDRYYDAGRSTIAHELFHQWFGDLVTCESWSNLTVNESFADFSEMLWAEHRYGRDAADAHSHDAMTEYLSQPDAATKDLVRFHYVDKEEVFDVVTYQKGGRILNMLRNYLGDAAFFKGLNIYLNANKFSNGEAQQLRLALEEASGRDLNWFFNQWYYGAGHPVLDINYKWDRDTKTERVFISQKQAGQLFRLPVAVDLYAAGRTIRQNVWLSHRTDTLTFHSGVRPDLVNVDADKILLAKKTDAKSLEELLFQYRHAPLYLDRYEAIDAAQSRQSEKAGRDIVLAALNDKYYGLRIKAIKALSMDNNEVHQAALPVLLSLARTDENTLVRAAALMVLGSLKDPAYLPLYNQSEGSASYAIQGAALLAINQLDTARAMVLAKGFEKDNSGALTLAMTTVFAGSGSADVWPFVYKQFSEGDVNTKFGLIRSFCQMTAHVARPEYAQQGIEELRNVGIHYKVYGGVAPFIINALNDIRQARLKMNDKASADAAEAAAKSVGEAK